MLARFILISALVTFIIGCESETTFGESEGAPSVLTETGAAVTKAECPAGGVEIEVGIDIDLDGNLDTNEVSDVHIICNGEDGNDADVATLTDLIENQQDKMDELQVAIDALQAEVASNTAKTSITDDQTAAITANTAKAGITTEQADAITANTEKVGATAEQAAAIVANTAKTGITAEQADAIVANTEKVGATTEQAAAILANTAKAGITTEQADAIVANTAKTGLTTEQADAIVANTAKTGTTTEQADAIVANTAKAGISAEQTDAIDANTGKAGISDDQAAAIDANTAKAGITAEQADAIVANADKVGITAEQVDAIAANTAKAAITPEQADAIAANTAATAQPGGPDLTADHLAAIDANTAKVGVTQDLFDAVETNAEEIVLTEAFAHELSTELEQTKTAVATNTAKASFPGFGSSAGKALEGDTELPDLNGYATEDWVAGQSYATVEETVANAAAIATNSEIIAYNAEEIAALADAGSACSPGLASISTGLDYDFGGGSGNVCAVKTDGGVSCWGRCDDGRCGDGVGDNHKQADPSPVLNIDDATAIAMGSMHGCATHETGAVSCWGWCSDGRCGNGKTENHVETTPIFANGIADAIDVAAGADFTCAVHETGAISCWGRCDDGRCGDGISSNHNQAEPVSVLSIDDAVDVAAGPAGFACAVHATGAVSCWGRCDDGQCGDGNTDNHIESTPVHVVGIADAVVVALGSSHACALRATGEVECWGRCDDGKCGDGATANHTEGKPVSVLNISDAVALDTGSDHTCVALADGGVSCWGRCDDGRCGDGNTENHKVGTAVQAEGIDSAVEITVGADHACAVLANGEASCWGRCDDGRCGDGIIESHKEGVPVSVEGSDFAMCY